MPPLLYTFQSFARLTRLQAAILFVDIGMGDFPMTNISKEGMAIAPGVVETIISLAVRDVDGVVGVGHPTTGILGLFQNKAEVAGVEINPADDGSLEVGLNITVLNGRPMTEIADQVRTAVSDAVLTQVGLSVSRVDVTVDGVIFKD